MLNDLIQKSNYANSIYTQQDTGLSAENQIKFEPFVTEK